MTEEGIVYRDELDWFARMLPGLRVVYVITRPTDGWTGRCGYLDVQTVNAELGDPHSWTYYVVGPPPMVTAMDKVTAELDIADAQIVKENFAGYTS